MHNIHTYTDTFLIVENRKVYPQQQDGFVQRYLQRGKKYFSHILSINSESLVRVGYLYLHIQLLLNCIYYVCREGNVEIPGTPKMEVT